MQQNTSAGTNLGFLFKKYYIENSGRLWLGLGSIVGAMAVMGFLSGAFSVTDGSGLFVIFGIILSVVGLAAASQMFSDMRTKEGRISLLMTPASAFSEFFVRWTVWVPGCLAALVIAFYIGDWSRMLGAFLFDHYVERVHLSDFFTARTFYVSSICFMMYLALQSFFVLGAVLWPKLSFLKTVIALWLLQTVLGTVASLSVMSVRNKLAFIIFSDDINFEDRFGDGMYALVIGFYALVCLVNWSIAWLRLKESDAI
ncbi:MAG: hypothetical protein K2M57_06540 [Paramuribaculum sp.]|nr:hypothetical protein [Paramuribaculum sp.]